MSYKRTALMALARSPRSTTEMSYVMSASIAKLHIRRFLDKLAERGLVVRKNKQWRITEAGLRYIETADSQQMDEYRSPIVCRRPGSDRASTLPSRVGERLIYPR